MVSFPMKFAITLWSMVITRTISSSEYKTECNYFNEPGFPSITSSLYDTFNPSPSTNYSYKIQSGSYALNFCNFDSLQNSNNGGFSWKYECCNPENNNNEDLCIYIYEGTTNCDLSEPSFETIILSTSSEYEYQCNNKPPTNIDCTLSISYYQNTQYQSPETIQCSLSSEPYSTLGLINGGCAKSSLSENTYIGQRCHPSISSYFQLGTFNDADCTSGAGYEIIRAGECSPDDISYGYDNIECTNAEHLNDLRLTELPTLAPTGRESVISTPTPTLFMYRFDTTTSTSSTELIEECIYVWWDDIYPIIIGNTGNDYCVSSNDYGSFNFFCSDNELWSHLWINNRDCSGIPNIRGLANNLFPDHNLTDYNCKGHPMFCNEITVYRNIFNHSDYKQCMIDIKTNPDEILPIAANNLCIDNMKYECSDNQGIQINMYDDNECNGNIMENIHDLRQFDECIYSPECNDVITTEIAVANEMCNYAMIGNIPWIISDEEIYCVSFYDQHVSGYLTCDNNKIMWTLYNDIDCNGYSSKMEAETAFGNIYDYNCMGNNDNCNWIYVTQNEYSSDNPNYPVPTHHECMELTQSSPQKKYPIIIDECIQNTKFYCNDDNINFGLNVTSYNDNECESVSHFGFGFVNDELNVKCVYTDDCPTAAPTIEPEIDCGVSDIFYTEECLINPCDRPCIINEQELKDKGTENEIRCEINHCGCVARWFDGDQSLECEDIAFRINMFISIIISVYVLFLY